jgi:glycine betaine/proline transport system substrate-binding protein
VGWDDNVAISSLTKVLLEERMNYREVELRDVEPEAAFQGVADGQLDALLAVRLPDQTAALEEVADDVATMNSWLVGTTRSSLAAPAYMDARTLEEARAAGASRALVIRPGGAPIGALSEDAVPADTLRDYGLEEDSGYPDASAMLEEVDRLYEEREPFLFVAWTPHWMNERYEFNYIEDHEVLDDLTRPARPHMIARKDLIETDPLAHALIDAIVMTEYQATSLQLAIQDADDPEEGARAWARDNKKLTNGWIENARDRISEDQDG